MFWNVCLKRVVLEVCACVWYLEVVDIGGCGVLVLVEGANSICGFGVLSPPKF